MKNNSQDTSEELANKLKYLSANKSDNQALFSATLQIINTQEVTTSNEQRYLLQSNETNVKQESWLMSKFAIYAPLTAIVVIAILTGTFVFKNNQQKSPVINSSNVSSQSSTSANGSIQNTVTAISAESNEEVASEEQLSQEVQAATSDLTTTAKLVGDTSNDTSF